MAYDYEREVKSKSTSIDIDLGLRAYMNKVYSFMAVGLALTGVIAHLTSTLAFNFSTNTYTSFGADLWFAISVRNYACTTRLYYSFKYGYCENEREHCPNIIFGLSHPLWDYPYHSIFIQYTGESVARVFFISAGAFGAFSLYGYTTKKDLSGWGSFLFIGLIGILIASIVNIFVASTALQFAISVIGVLVFAGLTAYDTQRIKAMYFDGTGNEEKKQ